jgi:hypothetical protein
MGRASASPTAPALQAPSPLVKTWAKLGCGSSSVIVGKFQQRQENGRAILSENQPGILGKFGLAFVKRDKPVRTKTPRRGNVPHIQSCVSPQKPVRLGQCFCPLRAVL